MEFKEFISNVEKKIPEYLSEYDIDKIHIEEVYKNNGILCTGMAVCLKGESIAPNIYLEYFHNLYEGGQTMDNILSLIRDEYNEAHSNIIMEDYTELSREELHNCVFMKLINYDKNQELLKDCPHIRFMDLAITFRFLVRKDEDGIASAMIRNQDIESFGVTVEELYELGKVCNKKLFPPSLKPLEEVLNDIIEGFDMSDCFGLQVLTNQAGINGAIYLTYEDLIKEYSEKIDSDLYILPSSIHEVLLLPVSESIKREELLAMVKDINEYVVEDMDYLSDQVYFYSRKKGLFIP